MGKHYDTVLFDLDGTLLDTLEDLADGVNASLEQNGFPKRTLEEIRSFVGNGVAKLMERAIPGGLANDRYDVCLKEFKEAYGEHIQRKTRAYPGIPELLEQLRQEGYKLGIVSNKFDLAVKKLNDCYFPGLIQVAVGSMDHVPRKPAPDGVFRAMEELGAEKARTVYVGDSEVDIATARNAGIPCISISWGFRSREELAESGASVIVERPDALLEYLHNLDQGR